MSEEVKIEVKLVFKDMSGNDLDEKSSYKIIDGNQNDKEKNKVHMKNDT